MDRSYNVQFSTGFLREHFKIFTKYQVYYFETFENVQPPHIVCHQVKEGIYNRVIFPFPLQLKHRTRVYSIILYDGIIFMQFFCCCCWKKYVWYISKFYNCAVLFAGAEWDCVYLCVSVEFHLKHSCFEHEELVNFSFC